jgi:hypothetical protein
MNSIHLLRPVAHARAPARIPDTRPSVAIAPVADLTCTARRHATCHAFAGLFQAQLACDRRVRLSADRRNADYVVETAVVRFANQVQVVVRLVADGAACLTRTYTGQPSSVQCLLPAITANAAADILAAIGRRSQKLHAC